MLNDSSLLIEVVNASFIHVPYLTEDMPGVD